MHRITMTIVLASSLLSVGHAQQASLINLAEPEKLSELVNTRNEELMPWVYNDGRNLVLTRILGKKKKELMEFVRKDTASMWMPNASFKPIKDSERSFIIGISHRGDTVYQLKATSSRKMLSVVRHIRSVRRSQVMVQKIPFEGKFYAAYVASDESVILLSIRSKGTMGLEDLYVIHKDKSGKWQKQISLGPLINTSGFETSPFLLPDKTTLVFSSDRPGGFGDADLYCSLRLDDSWQKWSKPVNLGKAINSNHFDAYLSMTPGGEIFFSSNKDANLSDIYHATRKQPKVERPAINADTAQVVIKEETIHPVVEPMQKQIHRVVVGAFEFRQNAEKFVSRLKGTQQSTELFYEETRRLYYVVIFTSGSLEEARANRNTYRTSDNRDLWDAWVYTRNVN